MSVSVMELQSLASGFDPIPERSFSLPARSYIQPDYLEVERKSIFYKSWQFACHVSQVANPGDYYTMSVQGQSIVILRDREGMLRAFYNVCRHRAHELVQGQGKTKVLVCPYHAWSYKLNGELFAARRSEMIENFDMGDFCLHSVQVEEFCSLLFVNLDPKAGPLIEESGGLADEIHEYAPDMDQLVHAHCLTYTIKANWKAVIDNFLECYHCPVAHRDFVSLVDMDTYEVTTYGIYSSHMASAGVQENSAYNVEDADVQDHAVWWLWPNTCLLRYPGEGNFMVWKMMPIDEETTYETFDFYFLRDKPTEQQWEAIEYINEVLQKEDIGIVESVQRGMRTPAYEQGRFVCDPEGSGLSEHAVHHFHSIYLKAISQHINQLEPEVQQLIHTNGYH